MYLALQTHAHAGVLLCSAIHSNCRAQLNAICAVTTGIAFGLPRAEGMAG